MKGVLAVDIGTTSLRTVLFDADGRALHIEQRQNAPGYFEGGRVEQDAATWRDALLATLAGSAAVLQTLGMEPACIAVTGQRSSVLPVDAAGVPLHAALMWQDTRGASLVQEMAEHTALVYGRTGLKISPVFSAVKMAWLRRERPAVWHATHKLLGVQDWAIWLLTGRYATDHSFGSRTNLLDLRTRDWDAELLRLFGVPRDKLCELVPPGAIVGGLAATAAAATGLPAGLPVVSAGGDQQCAALGLGLFEPGHAVSNTGTGSYLIGHALAPALDAQMRVSCNVAAVPGAYIVEAAMLTSGAVQRWFRGITGLAEGDHDTLDAEAGAVPPGAHGLLLLPHFKGCGTPHWDAQALGAFVNLSLSTTRGTMARAVLEAVALELKEGLDIVEALCGHVDAVHVSGGMTRSTLFNRIQCDMLQRPLLRFRGNEATAQGAWIAACVACGLAADHRSAFARLAEREAPEAYQPDPTTRDAYHRLRLRAQAAYDALAAPRLRAAFGSQEQT